jgi:hypothetical protein
MRRIISKIFTDADALRIIDAPDAQIYTIAPAARVIADRYRTLRKRFAPYVVTAAVVCAACIAMMIGFIVVQDAKPVDGWKSPFVVSIPDEVPVLGAYPAPTDFDADAMAVYKIRRSGGYYLHVGEYDEALIDLGRPALWEALPRRRVIEAAP